MIKSQNAKTLTLVRIKEISVNIICSLGILLFLYAAVNKLVDYEKFQVQLGLSPILFPFSDIIAWFIPIVELIIALLLLIPRVTLIGLYAFYTLMVVFTIYIFIILNYSENIPCSCGGILEEMGWKTHLIFNIVFVIMALAGIIMKTTIIGKKAIK
ncbi:MauE/DoxX family redox-associated membrane protein [Pedobacter metabolipauper]|uniref:Methylamine utilization protein MauE n=1 Tax=Pedobacter metabolipauper TaxID=425513 RepID=A0A4R6SVS6_9SPHI|nr:MauE/DoxX family redox-associated membrane protein [Pedobacter metabolipauper]TDQ08471.1 methylamine utilization protein MauE [Pedobacter metabolipauper]